MKRPLMFVAATCLAISQASASVVVTAGFVVAHEKKQAADKAAPPAEGEAPKKPAAPAGAAPATTGPKPITQERALSVTIRNDSSKPVPGVTVRYWFIGRDMKTMKAALLDGGEATADLKPNGVDVVVSDPVKSSYTLRQTFIDTGKAGAKPAAAKPAAGAAEAGGTKVAGYGVQVIKDNKVIAESFLEPGYKTLVGSDGQTPGALFKAKKEDAPGDAQ